MVLLIAIKEKSVTKVVWPSKYCRKFIPDHIQQMIPSVHCIAMGQLWAGFPSLSNFRTSELAFDSWLAAFRMQDKTGTCIFAKLPVCICHPGLGFWKATLYWDKKKSKSKEMSSIFSWYVFYKQSSYGTWFVMLNIVTPNNEWKINQMQISGLLSYVATPSMTFASGHVR